jgi:hypothetical protein
MKTLIEMRRPVRLDVWLQKGNRTHAIRHMQTVLLLAVSVVAVSLLTPACAQEHLTIPELSPVRVAEVATILPEKPAGFGPPCSNRTAWRPELGAFENDIVAAEQFVSKPLPPWDDNKYLEFTREGTRPGGEAMIRQHDGQLSTLVLAECDEWRGRFIPRIAEQLDAISAQRSWTLPAHDPKLESFNGTRYFVDLGAAVLGHVVAESLYLLGDKLPEPTRKRAMVALELHMFAPMRESIAGKHREFWFYAASNWNAVCWNGATAAALTVLPDRRDRALFAAAAELYSNGYLGSYTDGGYAEEGIAYWGYGFSNYEELREQLWHSTRGKIDLYNNPKARKSALFPFQFQMLPGVYADFGDAAFMTKPDPVLMARIDRIFGLGIMKLNDQSETIGGDVRGSLPEAMLRAFPVPSERKPEGHGSEYDVLVGLRTYYPDAGVLVSRPAPGGHLAVTIKADGNGGHSHNDVGSYSIGLGTTQPVGDPGGPHYYNAETFTSKRFDSPLLNSFGHPVPTIDGHLQLEATKVRAPVFSSSFTAEQDSIAIDMSKAYDDPKLNRLIRTLHYNRAAGGSVEIEDHFDISSPIDIEEVFPAHGTWKQLDAKTLRFDLGDAHLRVMIKGAGAFTLSADPINAYGEVFTRVAAHMHLAHSTSVVLRFSALP